MRNSKSEIIEEALKNLEVAKTVEGIVRTKPDSKLRGNMVEAFTFKFSEIATKIFNESVVGSFSRQVEAIANVTFGGKLALLSTIGIGDDIFKILNEKLEFEIRFEDRNIIFVQQILSENDETIMSAKFFFSGDEIIDKIIIDTLNVLRKK